MAAPFEIAINLIPTLPRPMLARFVEKAIERLDAEDGDPDMEDDDPAEDEHDREREEGDVVGTYGNDQRIAIATAPSRHRWAVDHARMLGKDADVPVSRPLVEPSAQVQNGCAAHDRNGRNQRAVAPRALIWFAIWGADEVRLRDEFESAPSQR